MQTVFEFKNYKDFLLYLVSHASAPRGMRASFAKVMGCQAAYLSQVLNGKAELTEDHSYKLVKHLGLGRHESRYFMTLVRLSRASTPELRDFLVDEAEQLAAEAAETHNKVGSKRIEADDNFANRYFVTWIPSTIHIATSSAHYRSVEDLSQRLRLKPTVVAQELAWLEQENLIEKDTHQRWRFRGESIHLPKNSPLNVTHQLARRSQAARSIEMQDTQQLHFSSLFTLDRRTFLEIKELMTKAIENSHQLIHQGGTEEIYALCVDLFEIV
jgi:uncharacterized protein (TIGR02147 family)